MVELKQAEKSNLRKMRNESKYDKRDGVWIDVGSYLFTIIALIICSYPFIYVFSMSVSDPGAVISGRVRLFPIGFELGAYKIIIQNTEIWRMLGNTMWIVVVGTILSLLATVLAAYPLSRKEIPFKRAISFFITFTMFFSGGMIPSYLLIKQLGLINSLWSLVLPGAASAWNIMLARTYFKTIPESLIESAKLDGCRQIGILFKIIIPLSMPIVAVIILYAAVGHWNSYFNAMIYITDPRKQPLQLYLRRVLFANSSNNMLQELRELTSNERTAYEEQLKYAVIIFTILPIVGLYPFLQKYFVKGVMVGSIKE